MTDYILFFLLFTVPVLLGKLRTFRKGLTTSLFILLIFLGAGSPLLLAVPFSAALFLFVTEQKKAGLPAAQPANIKNPASLLMTVFLIFMAIFCAFGDAFYNYGLFLSLDERILTLAKQCAGVGFLTGPLVLGNRCDRKGPFNGAIFLALFAELSVLFAGNASNSALLFVLGNFLLAFSISGFFVLIPLLVCAFYGQRHFLRLYPASAAIAALCGCLFRHFYITAWSKSINPANFLFDLLFLVIVSAFCIFMAWKRRLVLVPAI